MVTPSMSHIIHHEFHCSRDTKTLGYLPSPPLIFLEFWASDISWGPVPEFDTGFLLGLTGAIRPLNKKIENQFNPEF